MDTAAAADKTIPNEIIEIEIPYELFQYLDKDKHNLDSVCRICLSINENTMYSLFTPSEEAVLVNIIKALSEVQINEDDNLPKNICENCQNELLNCFDFKNKCIKSDYILRSVLMGEFVDRIKEDQVENDSKTQENLPETVNVKNFEIKLEIKEEDRSADITNIDYLEDLKESTSENEFLNEVRQRKNKEKKITDIVNEDTEDSYKEVLSQDKVKRRSKKKIKHSCSFCPKKFRKVTSLRTHTSKHHKEKRAKDSLFPCDQCKESFNSDFDLRLHGMLHTAGPNWECTECHKEFKVRTALRRHIRRHMQCRQFSCEICGKTFVELCALNRHARVHTGVRSEKKLCCKYCDKRYADRSSLEAHESRHSGRRAHACVCGKRFANARLLASHQRMHSDEKPFVCHHAGCGKRFRHGNTRNTHMLTHTGERPHACTLCHKTFIQRSNLNSHMRTHTGERPYKCSYCDNKFSTSSTLKAHIRTHTGEKPFTCKICGKMFARVSLTQHMRLHTGERPFACGLCAKAFVNATRLREHQRTHTGEKPFECATCSSKFTTKSHLIKHLQSNYRCKHNANRKGMFMPVTVTDKSLTTEKPTQFVIVNEPKENLPTFHVGPVNDKTEVILVGEQNLLTNGIAYVNDLNCTSNMELVTVNEEGMSLTTGNQLTDGTVKVYQYDQSLVQIHSSGSQLTISRISSKMTTNLI